MNEEGPMSHPENCEEMEAEGMGMEEFEEDGGYENNMDDDDDFRHRGRGRGYR